MSSDTVELIKQEKQEKQEKRLLVFATHPFASNGYAKVVYNLVKRWSCDDVNKITLYGFQNMFPEDMTFSASRPIPNGVEIIDAFALESPKAEGFALDHIETAMEKVRPHTILVYSDMMIVHLVIDRVLKWAGGPRPRIIVYLDQVYPYQKREYVEYVNQYVDTVVVFSPRWKQIAENDIGLTMQIKHVPHGFDTATHPVIPQDFARRLLGLDTNDFIVLNLNRNQPRKRWDVCLAAWAEFVSKNREKPVRLLIGTSPTHNAWDLRAIYANELRKRNVPIKEGESHVIYMERPQRATDAYITLLYNATDIGINTCDGEGFGLCQLEHACLGKPQIVPALGAFTDIFDDDCAQFVTPRINYYLDSKRDGVGGEAAISFYCDFADAIQRYFDDPELRNAHGLRCMSTLPKKYDWDTIASSMFKICQYDAAE
jgi:glycosyltransferase involved in cell wall biosynthesis